MTLRSISAFLLSALTSASIVAGGKLGETWMEGESYTPIPGQHQPPFEIVGWGSEDGDHLLGLFIYKFHRYPDDPPPGDVRGARRGDSFWPNVTFQVSNSWDGPWETVGKSRQGDELLAAESEKGYSGLRVNLDAFAPYVGKLKCGRIVVDTGEAGTLGIDRLIPPSQRPEHK